MKSFFDDFKKDFLLPSGDNFSDLLEKMQYLNDRIQRQAKPGVPRIPLQNRFSYSTTDYHVPIRGRSSEDILNELSDAFQGTIRWNQPSTLINITPNPLLDSVAAANIATSYNINCLWDYMSGGITRLEKSVIAFLCKIANWDVQEAAGISTFGGKATLMYAMRCGLNVCDRQSVTKGLEGNYVVITGENSHYSIEDSCNYLGIGRDNVVRVRADKTGAMEPRAFEEAMRECIEQNKKIAAIVLLGSDTIQYSVDPVKQIFSIRNRLVDEFSLSYIPYMHLDSVIGWIGLVFGSYDFNKNPLEISTEAKMKIQSIANKISGVEYVDSFSADFHKTGLSPYISSFFVAKNAGHIHSINKDHLQKNSDNLYGEIHTHHYSFENSRSANAIVGAWTSIQRLGVEGYQKYWAQLISTSLYLNRLIISKYDADMRVLNTDTLGYAIVIQFIPPKLNTPYEELINSNRDLQLYNDYCFQMHEHIAYELLESNEPYPLLGFIPDYGRQKKSSQSPVFLLYSNHPNLSPKDCDQILGEIIGMKHTFDKKWIRNNYTRHNKSRPKHLPR